MNDYIIWVIKYVIYKYCNKKYVGYFIYFNIGYNMNMFLKMDWIVSKLEKGLILF